MSVHNSLHPWTIYLIRLVISIEPLECVNILSLVCLGFQVNLGCLSRIIYLPYLLVLSKRPSQMGLRFMVQDKKILFLKLNFEHLGNIFWKSMYQKLKRTNAFYYKCVTHIFVFLLFFPPCFLVYCCLMFRNLSSGSPGHTHVKLKSMTMKELEVNFLST